MNTRMKTNRISNHLPYLGTTALLLGMFCFAAKAISPEYLDAEGFLHERFFLLPLGYLFLLAGILLFLFAGIRRFAKKPQK